MINEAPQAQDNFRNAFSDAVGFQGISVGHQPL